jgi:cell fate regulator YaaT (PSP1 superfamily)
MPKYVVRHGVMRSLGVLSTRGSDTLQRGAQVIARTQRGLEAGEVLCEATDEVVAQLKDPVHGQVLREMTAEDLNELAHMKGQEAREFEICQKYVNQLALQMQLVDIEHVFGGERIVIYYLAENRVDFRELVRLLASEFQTRIEMRQIGVRDEAKLLADYGDCGKPVCCNTHLSEMPPVSMKMAKLQKATLDPTKISGRCGRLKCCLRYEYDTYEEYQKDLPPIGSEVVTQAGRARILNQEILARQVLVQTEDGRRILIEASDVLTVLDRGSGNRPSRGQRDDGESESPEQTGKSEKQERPRGGRRDNPRHQRPTEDKPPSNS